jgi:hypothetical protein
MTLATAWRRCRPVLLFGAGGGLLEYRFLAIEQLVTAVDTPWPDGAQVHIGPTGQIAYALPQQP